MQLDPILGLAARAIQAVVDPLGRADIEARDDEADVEAEHRRLNTGDDAPFAIPCGASRSCKPSRPYAVALVPEQACRGLTLA